MPALSEQTVVITGAAQGLGAGIARVFAAGGAGRLILMDKQADALRAVNTEIGGGADCIACDLADPEELDAVMSKIAGPVDTLVHNAALLRPEPFETVSLATFQATLDVGIQAAFQLSQAVWPGMKANGGGALIFVSSQSGIKGFVDETAYCAAKHAIEGFSKCLAMEGRRTGSCPARLPRARPCARPCLKRTTHPN